MADSVVTPKVCSVDGCGRPFYAKGLCNNHWKRWKKTGENFDRSLVKFQVKCNGEKCSAGECEKLAIAKGLCKYHWDLARKEIAHRCSLSECKRPVAAKGFCTAHYKRWKKQGDNFNKGAIRIQINKINKICSVKDCHNKSTACGMCIKHYTRKKKHETTSLDLTEVGSPLRFLRKLIENPPNECVTWPFSKKEDGYGRLRYNGKNINAHRVSLALYQGIDIPESTIECRHVICGNGHLGCVNPIHLGWGTRQQNCDDMIIHGRSPRGERHPNAKLTRDEILAIRKSPSTSPKIAEKFNISASYARKIKSRDRWKWLD